MPSSPATVGGGSPALIACAARTISERAAWRKISVRRTVGTAPDSMRSSRTRPGPDRRELVDVADEQHVRARADRAEQRVGEADRRASRPRRRSACRGPGSGPPARARSPRPGTYSSSRWIVLASAPVSSPSRRAALPVGAHSRTLRFCVAQQVHERAHRLRLARARQAGEDRQPVLERVRHRLPLGVGRDEGAVDRALERVALAPAQRRRRLEPARARCAPGAARSRASPGPRRARPPRRASRRRPARRGGPRRRRRAAAARARAARRAGGGSGRRPRPGAARGAARRRCATGASGGVPSARASASAVANPMPSTSVVAYGSVCSISIAPGPSAR